MIRNIIFDFGGVIAPIDRDRAVQAFIRLGLKDADSRLDKYHQTGIFQQLEEGTLTEQEFRETLGQLCGRPLTFEEVKEAWMGFFSGVDERILTLSWACSKHFSPAGKPLDAYFDKLYLSYEMGHTKPDERIFRHILSDAQLNAAETLFVDDGASNVQMGADMGMHTFQPVNGSDWRSELTALLEKLNKAV